MSKRITFGSVLGLADTSFPDLPAFVKEAEDMGFDQFSIGEHIMDGVNPKQSAMSIPALAAAGGATKRIRLHTGIVILPLYQPILLAKMISILDQVTNGRLDFGIGIGGHRDLYVEFDAVGVPLTERGSRSNESLELMKRLWTEDRVTFEGSHYNCKNVKLLPTPLQKPHPPIWVSGRNEAAMQRAVKYGDGWYPYPLTSEEFKVTKDRIIQIAIEKGRDLSNFRWGLLYAICIASTTEQARGIAKANINAFTRGYLPPGTNEDEIIDRYAIVGSPEECIRQIQKRVDVGVDHIGLAWITPDDKEKWEMMRKVSRTIIPYFRN